MAGDGRRRRLPLSLRRDAVAWERQRPTWRDAKPALIAGALKRAQARPSGNWYVVGSSRDVTECVGGGDEIFVDDLHQRYETACDPRLNR
ncbi:3-deoxy-7-phosphoheptulonate synthase, partial [Streptomyces griseoincarnatus]